MIDFVPTEEQQIMRDSVGQFARSTLAERVREFEQERGIPADICTTATEMCLGSVALPEACGGHGLGMVTAVLLEEEIGKADAAAAFALPGPGTFGTAVIELASEEQAATLLEPFTAPDTHAKWGAVAWSEAKPHPERAGMSALAVPHDGGFKLSGTKCYVINAHLAERFVVFAQLDESAGWSGIGAFVVDKSAPGLAIGERYDTLGLNAASFGAITLNDVAVTAEARLMGGDDFTLATLRFFTRHALLVAARAVGLSQLAFDTAREYCDTRRAFGKPIGHFQAVAFNLADRLMDVESARWMVWKAAWSWDTSKDTRRCLQLSAAAAAHALEAAMRCADDCVSLHGGMGFIRDLVAEKLMRDAKQLALCCPTAEQLDQISAAVELSAPLDPALVLPTPETQAIFT